MGLFRRTPGDKDREAARKLVGEGRKYLERDWWKAVELFDKSLKKDPENTDALEGKAFALANLFWLQRGMAISYSGQLIPGRTAIRLDKKSSLRSAIGGFKQTLEVAEKELELNPRSGFALRVKAFAFALLGLWYDDLGYQNNAESSYKEAERFSKQVLDLDAKDTFASLVQGISKELKSDMPNILGKALEELKPWS